MEQIYKYIEQHATPESEALKWVTKQTHIRTNHKKVFWGAIISPIIFSGVMEILQSLFTTYRTGDIWDFLFNTLGVVSAAFFAVYVMKPVMRRYV